jgi:adenine-specific DNA-methyltransferase
MKQKLELTWVGKDQRHRLEPRVLLETPELSYTAQTRVTDADIFDNRLIFGDNLLALKALEQELAGQVKCIFIDPPYNTGSAFEHYDDGIEHSLWLSMMRDRLELLRTLLSEDGSIWITVDQNESHYLKVMMDEIFGRGNFVCEIIWRSADSSNNDTKQFSLDHNTLLVYSRNPDWLSIRLSRTEESDAHYANPDNDPRGAWFSGNLSSPKPRKNLMFDIISPSGNAIKSPKNGWRWSQETMLQKIKTQEIIFVSNETKIIRKTYLADQKGLAPSSVWDTVEETGHNRQAKYELIKLFPEMSTNELFDTPKPERLIKRILEISTLEGDLVLDSFAGSGTTGAVAHKMGRRWVMIEVKEATAETFIIPRLQKVVDGTDQGGISQSVGWKGGGGFRYYHLAKSVLTKDKWDNWIINPGFNAALLAEAMCKIEGYTYCPSDTEYWNQGYCNENSFIFVTTQYLTLEQLEMISEDVGLERNLLIMGSSYSGGFEAFNNLTLKKIPQAVLDKCEYGRDDYSLKIENLPSTIASLEPEVVPSRRKNINAGVPSLFGEA